MTVKECYAAFGGDYDGAVGRLMKEERIAKYLKLFAAGEELTTLVRELEAENFEPAFRAVHNIKGLALNLGLTPLIPPAETLCEALRHGAPAENPAPMLAAVQAAFDTVASCAAQLD